jgi:glycosyltransferase involved in cell wall biosynthesis
LVFVDDGSTDATSSRLAEIAMSSPGSFDVISQSSNRGKAEAVRRGINQAFDGGATYVGYWDADLATPLAEIPRFVETLDAHPDLEMLFGSRVQLLGRTIDRWAWRHYLGRVSATAISLTLGLAVYDTQCGAKLFRSGPETRRLFEDPFLSNWVFDVELIARWREGERTRGLLPAEQIIYELPLDEWVDVAGSKVRPADFRRAMLEIWRIRRRYLGRSDRPAAGG